MEQKEIPHIVKEFYVGYSKVKIADNYYSNKSKEEIDKILKKIAQIALQDNRVNQKD